MNKFTKLFLITFSVWTIDFITTMIGLSKGLVESNPLYAYIYSFGLPGYIFGYIFAFGVMFLFSKIVIFLYEQVKEERFSEWIYYAGYLLAVFEIYPILNNIFLIK